MNFAGSVGKLKYMPISFLTIFF
uniref:Uncharacterized protein n=1 Tax=Arundo donax TaxID=35708 RepID=A0A0A9B943_ARUDO